MLMNVRFIALLLGIFFGAGQVAFAQLRNPMEGSGIDSIPGFFLSILDILLVFAIPFVVFFIIYAGFLYVTARGNPGTIEQAHKALLYAIIGGLLIFGARAILAIITNTVNSTVRGTALDVVQLIVGLS
jgi:hypothetical protein